MLVHGNNLAQKERRKKGKYTDNDSRDLLAKIRAKYDGWHKANSELVGPGVKPSADDAKVIEERVKMLAGYKDFIDQQVYAEHFDSRSNLHSSVLEEFLYYLFKDMVAEFGNNALMGKSHTFKDLFFVPPSYKDMVTRPYACMEVKDHDFVIGVRVDADMSCAATRDADEPAEAEADDGVDEAEGGEQLAEVRIIEGHESRPGRQTEHLVFDVPAVAIECKTYLDKSMLEASSMAGVQLKARNPNALYIVVMEWIKLTEKINLRKYQVDQIYVLRRQKNTDREYRFAEDYAKNPIYSDVVIHLFDTVRAYLAADWKGGVEFGLTRGWLI